MASDFVLLNKSDFKSEYRTAEKYRDDPVFTFDSFGTTGKPCLVADDVKTVTTVGYGMWLGSLVANSLCDTKSVSQTVSVKLFIQLHFSRKAIS